MIIPKQNSENSEPPDEQDLSNSHEIGVVHWVQAAGLASRARTLLGTLATSDALLENMAADEGSYLERFFKSKAIKEHTPETIAKDRSYWSLFKSNRMVSVPRGTGDERRQVFIWDVMSPRRGHEVLHKYADELHASDLSAGYRRHRMGIIKRLGDYILEHPYLFGQNGISVFDKYGPLVQNVDEELYPKHVRDEPKQGRAFNRRQLRALYHWLNQSVRQNQRDRIFARDLALIILAAETGLRVDELVRLNAFGPEVSLFFADGNINAEGKGAKGSGKRFRLIPLSPLARAVLAHYLVKVRPQFDNWQTGPAVFLTERGTRLTYAAAYNRITVRFKQARDAGIDVPAKVSPHSLRRTKLTLFLEANPRGQKEAEQILGHSGPNTLPNYYCPDAETLTRDLEARLNCYRP